MRRQPREPLELGGVGLADTGAGRDVAQALGALAEELRVDGRGGNVGPVPGTVGGDGRVGCGGQMRMDSQYSRRAVSAGGGGGDNPFQKNGQKTVNRSRRRARCHHHHHHHHHTNDGPGGHHSPALVLTVPAQEVPPPRVRALGQIKAVAGGARVDPDLVKHSAVREADLALVDPAEPGERPGHVEHRGGPHRPDLVGEEPGVPVRTLAVV